jgi:hypothetical protein
MRGAEDRAVTMLCFRNEVTVELLLAARRIDIHEPRRIQHHRGSEKPLDESQTEIRPRQYAAGGHDKGTAGDTATSNPISCPDCAPSRGQSIAENAPADILRRTAQL